MGQPLNEMQVAAQQTHIEIKPDGFGLSTDKEGWVFGIVVVFAFIFFLRSPLGKAVAALIEGSKAAVKKVVK